MTLKVVNKINGKLKFLYRNNSFLSTEFRRMLCNDLIQPYFDYECPAWYPNLTKKKKLEKIKIMQIKCIRFCLRLDKMHHISAEDFRPVNCLPTSKRVNQCTNTISFESVITITLNCRIDKINEFAKLQISFCKTNKGQKVISFVGPSLWEYLQELTKKTDNLNTFKRNVKNYCLNWINNELVNWASYCYYFRGLTILTYNIFHTLHVSNFFPSLFNVFDS